MGVSAETSYSRYQNYKNGVSGYTLALANTSGTGDRVMNIKGNVTISNDILGSGNYSSLISATLKYDGLDMLTSPSVTSNVSNPNTLQNNTGLLSGSDVISQGWGQHTVTASFTFDGVNASNGTSSLACHVTGLPYALSNMGTAKSNGWTSDNVTFTQNDRASMTAKEAWLVSPKFHVPGAINISIDLYACLYKLWTYDPYLYISTVNTQSGQISGTALHITKTTSNPSAGLSACELYQCNNLSMNSTNSYLSIYEYSSKGNGTCAVFLASVSMKYR